MRLIVLISIAVLIAVAAIGSYMHFRSWNAGRFDAIIVEAADRYDIDPALLKAVAEVQMRSVRRGKNKPDENKSRWGLIPNRVGDLYLAEHGKHEWCYVCPNRHFPNHDPNTPEQFTSTPTEFENDAPKRTCRARGCGQPLVYELDELRTNLEVVAWFLDAVRRYINQEDNTHDRSRPPAELRRLMVFSYRWELPTQLDRVELSNEQRRYLQQVEQAYAAFQPQFDKRAKRDRDSHHVPSAPF